ncbi:hypothetical protein, partial [Bradyrhizobium sp.]|uniref:hypothetical protein n=1 Tax=Bradyrhizobium sp. TaxID=376 RepID=UPI0025B9D6D3
MQERLPGPAISQYGQPKSKDAVLSMPGHIVSIAAQRRNLARSLLEWRLHGSRTLGNMDRSAAP